MMIILSHTVLKYERRFEELRHRSKNENSWEGVSDSDISMLQKGLKEFGFGLRSEKMDAQEQMRTEARLLDHSCVRATNQAIRMRGVLERFTRNQPKLVLSSQETPEPGGGL